MKFSAVTFLTSMLYITSVAADHGDQSSADNSTAAVSCRNNICYSFIVPEATVSSGNGSIWFQIYAPTSFSWVGLGTGTSMADSNMFLVYQDGEGNVTVSHRQASGRVMPTVPENDTIQMQLLDGSGVHDGFMVANVRCDNCDTWKDDQTLDFTSAGASMVGAWREGEALDTTDIDTQIGVHTGNIRTFSLDLTEAQVSTVGNPFVGSLAVPAEISGSNETGGENGEGGDAGGSAGTRSSTALVTTLGLAVLVAAFQFI